MTVTKKTLTATAASVSKVYGAAVPVIGVKYDGFVNGDDELDIDTAPTTSTVATAISPVVTGGYVASAVGGADDNYSFTYVNGVLNVTQAAATLTITGASQQYTGEPFRSPSRLIHPGLSRVWLLHMTGQMQFLQL